MTIKEMEERCGMNRGNIRFYEAQGLFTPERNRENGYRIYSEEDVQVLLKIKLLRLLDVPLEEIQGLLDGKEPLADVLVRNLDAISRREEDLARSREVSERMIREGADFAALDAARYLDALERTEGLAQDTTPRLVLPWRRFWARGLDWLLWDLAVKWALAPFPRWLLLDGVLTLLLALLAETALLRLFGTTPGKAVFGIRVVDPRGGRLSWGAALSRTWTVLWEGVALNVPLIREYFQYKDLRAVEKEETLPWEWDSELTFRDDRHWRCVLFFAIAAALCAAETMLTL